MNLYSYTVLRAVTTARTNTAPEPTIPLYRRVADKGAEQINNDTFRAGDRIPSLRRLCAQYEVSLSTALEACRVLEDRGLVEARPQSGHYVRQRPSTHSEPDQSNSSTESRRVDASLALK